ncbi:hypothetical protein, partial [Desulfosarcina cetonica]
KKTIFFTPVGSSPPVFSIPQTPTLVENGFNTPTKKRQVRTAFRTWHSYLIDFSLPCAQLERNTMSTGRHRRRAAIQSIGILSPAEVTAGNGDLLDGE